MAPRGNTEPHDKCRVLDIKLFLLLSLSLGSTCGLQQSWGQEQIEWDTAKSQLTFNRPIPSRLGFMPVGH